MSEQDVLRAILQAIHTAEASAEATEESTAAGWVVMSLDIETGTVDCYGPWDPGQQLDAARWAEEHTAGFTAAGDDGVPLQTRVFPLWRPSTHKGGAANRTGEST